MKKVLIIGASSFIATKFIKKHSSDFQIFCISRKKTGNQNETVITDFFQINGNSFEGIISDYNSNPACMEDGNIDELVKAINVIVSI